MAYRQDILLSDIQTVVTKIVKPRVPVDQTIPRSKTTDAVLCQWCCHPERRGFPSMPAKCICGTDLA